MEQNQVIIGAGMTGLTAAYRLAKAGKKVIVLEKTHDSGGLTTSLPVGRQTIERLYHHIFASDSYMLSLIAEVGLSEHFSFYRPRNGLLSGGCLYPFTSPLDLLRFKPLPFTERIKTGLTVLGAKKERNWQIMENQNAAEYLRRKSGATAYERLWRPLLTSKFGDDAETVSAVWIWNKFKLRGSSRDKNPNHESLGYLNGGFGCLTDKLTEQIVALGGKVIFDTNVNSIVLKDKADASGLGGYLVETNRERIEAQSVIAAVASPIFDRLSAKLPLPDTYRSKIKKAKYKANICLLAAFSKQVTPYYWTTICDELPFVVLVEQTNLTGTDGYGRHLLYLSRYLDVTDPLYKQSDNELASTFYRALFMAFPEAEKNFEGTLAITRSDYTQPVIPLHYSNERADMKTPLEGLYLAGMSQIYPEDRGLNYAARLGEQAAAAVLSGQKP